MSIRIVLVGTTHPGNIGAVARAMKNMGLAELALVDPRHFPHEEATARASGADDILDNATVVDSLAEAIEDCVYVAGDQRAFTSHQLADAGAATARSACCPKARPGRLRPFSARRRPG